LRKIVTRLLESLELEIGKTTSFIKRRLLSVCLNRCCKLRHRLFVLLAVKQLNAFSVIARPCCGFLFGWRFLFSWRKTGRAKKAGGDQGCDSTVNHHGCVLLPSLLFERFLAQRRAN